MTLVTVCGSHEQSSYTCVRQFHLPGPQTMKHSLADCWYVVDSLPPVRMVPRAAALPQHVTASGKTNHTPETFHLERGVMIGLHLQTPAL